MLYYNKVKDEIFTDGPVPRSSQPSAENIWERPEVSVPGADQKDRGLWGRECLTNEESLDCALFCLKHAGNGDSTKEVRGKDEPLGECFSLLLECYRRFLHVLSALQQNRAQPRPLNLLNILVPITVRYRHYRS